MAWPRFELNLCYFGPSFVFSPLSQRARQKNCRISNLGAALETLRERGPSNRRRSECTVLLTAVVLLLRPTPSPSPPPTAPLLPGSVTGERRRPLLRPPSSSPSSSSLAWLQVELRRRCTFRLQVRCIFATKGRKCRRHLLNKTWCKLLSRCNTEPQDQQFTYS